MYLLSIDSSGKMASVGIANDRQILYAKSVDSRVTQSIVIFDLLKEMSQKINLSLNQMNVVVVTVGPGSFTGLRVGIMTAKTISHLLKIPICGISSLEAFAYPFNQEEALVISVLDGSRGDVYVAAYWNHGHARVPVIEESLLKAEHFVEKLNLVLTGHHDFSQIILSGSGWEKHPALMEFLQSICLNRFQLIGPDSSSQAIIPENMIGLALEKYQINANWGDNALKLEPRYLRKPEAEIVYENRMLQNKLKNSS